MCHTVVLPNDREGHLCGQLVNPNYFFAKQSFTLATCSLASDKAGGRKRRILLEALLQQQLGFRIVPWLDQKFSSCWYLKKKKWFAISPRCFWVTAAMPNPHSVLAGQNANFLCLTHAPCVLVCKMSAFLLLHYLLPTYLDFLRNSIIYRRSRQSFMLIILLLCTFNCVWISL